MKDIPLLPMKTEDCCHDPAVGTQIRVGVMGSAAEIDDPNLIEQCRLLGRAIAERGACTLTGACPGMPHEVVLGAKAAGGRSMGISPAVHLKEHIETYGSPHREYDVMIYTGLGLMGRELINIRSSEIIVLVGGRCGTLGEFAIAYEEGKLIGVLTGTGGITNVLPQLVDSLKKKTGSEVLYDSDPHQLIARLLDRFHSPDYDCSCKPGNCGCGAFVSATRGQSHSSTLPSGAAAGAPPCCLPETSP